MYIYIYLFLMHDFCETSEQKAIVPPSFLFSPPDHKTQINYNPNMKLLPTLSCRMAGIW